MFYLDYLPYSVTQVPEIGALDVVEFYGDYIIRATDSVGHSWYVQTVGRSGYRYDWTRSRINSRCFVKRETAQKHADKIGAIWRQLIIETEALQ